METFHIEHAIAKWRRELRKHPGLEPGYIDELEGHLRDCIEDLKEEGASDEDAFRNARARTMTSVEEIADEYFKARTRRSIKPPWKERADWLGFIPPNILLAYLKQAFRSMKVAKVYTWINLLGLTLGIAASVTLFKYVLYEWRTDTFHSKIDRIAVSTIREGNQGLPRPSSPSTYAKFNYNSYASVEAATIIKIYKEPLTFRDKKFDARVLIGDTAFFKVFDFKVQNSDTENILNSPSTILISRELARKVFGSQDPLGKEIIFEGSLFTVQGLLENPSRNSSINFDAIASARAKSFWPKMGFECLAFASPDLIDPFSEKMKDAAQTHSQFTESTIEYLPLKDLYYNHQVVKRDWIQSGNRLYEQILLLIAVLILGVSVFNFINLNSVVLLKRHKELGIKKVMGAGKKELVLGLLLENLIQVGIATIMAGGFLWFFSPRITQFVNKKIFLDTELDLILLGGLAGVLTILLTLYPAFKFPNIKPIKTIKGAKPERHALTGRKLLMTVQFGITIFLLIVSLFFSKQLNYMLNRDLGFKSQNVIAVDFFPNEIPHYYYNSEYEEDTPEGEKMKADYERQMEQRNSEINRVSEEIERDPYIQHLSYGNSPLDTYEMSWRPSGKDLDYQTVNTLMATPNFDELYDLTTTQGRFFTEGIDKNRENKVLVNEAALQFFGLESWEDVRLSNSSWGGDKDPWQIIGVVEDYAYEHLSFGIKPLVILYFDDRDEDPFMMKLTKGKEQESLAKLGQLFKEVNPNDDFRYTFVDEEIDALYASDRRVVRIYSLFTFIALIVSALGLYGISSYDTHLRIKEIGIRKITGASVSQIIQLLTQDFFRYLLFAILVACPLGALAVMKYLESFAHRTSVSTWVFAAACGITLGVALLTMLWHTWRAASRNPVEALRNE